MRKKLLIFASGSATGGGSGFRKLLEAVKAGTLHAEIVAVVSNHENGGVRKIADEYDVRFIHFNGPYTAENYQAIVRDTQAEFVALSGWLKLVTGLDPRTTFNIHPGPLPEYGGKGLYGHHVHDAVKKAYDEGAITHSAVSMHFVTEEYDKGPVFFHFGVQIEPEDTAESIGQKVNKMEHQWQAEITQMVLQGSIAWDGENPASLIGKWTVLN